MPWPSRYGHLPGQGRQQPGGQARGRRLTGRRRRSAAGGSLCPRHIRTGEPRPVAHRPVARGPGPHPDRRTSVRDPHRSPRGRGPHPDRRTSVRDPPPVPAWSGATSGPASLGPRPSTGPRVVRGHGITGGGWSRGGPGSPAGPGVVPHHIRPRGGRSGREAGSRSHRRREGRRSGRGSWRTRGPAGRVATRSRRSGRASSSRADRRPASRRWDREPPHALTAGWSAGPPGAPPDRRTCRPRSTRGGSVRQPTRPTATGPSCGRIRASAEHPAVPGCVSRTGCRRHSPAGAALRSSVAAVAWSRDGWAPGTGRGGRPTPDSVRV